MPIYALHGTSQKNRDRNLVSFQFFAIKNNAPIKAIIAIII
jgi:hypothetical protein